MSNESLAENYLFMGPLIEARLRDLIGENIPVEGIELMSQARDAQDLRPMVMFVMWGGDRFPANVSGVSQSIGQRWIVWLRVRNASQADKDARSSAAGPYLSAIHKALAGWKPAQANGRSVVRTQGPVPDYQPASGLYPLAFEIPFVL